MRTQCPHCNRFIKCPDAYQGRNIKCPQCKFAFLAAAWVSPPTPDIVAETLKTIKKHNPIRSAWNRMPVPFKTAFLSTLGVISASMITFYFYGNIFKTKVSQDPYSFSGYKGLLESKGLFWNGEPPQTEILRGRSLTATCFVPDANKYIPHLKLWSDDKNSVAGFSAVWHADFMGNPAEIYEENQNVFLGLTVANCFCKLVKFDLKRIKDIKFEQDKKNEYGLIESGGWILTVSRGLSPYISGSKNFVDQQKKAGQDARIYEYSITAQSW
jgi:hypothetical protein